MLPCAFLLCCFLLDTWMSNALFHCICNTEPCYCPLYHYLHLRVIVVVLSLRIPQFGFLGQV
jgi:hypothetical protein